MPELPEVEVSCRSLLPHLSGQRICKAVFRVPKLRHALPVALAGQLAGRCITTITRRGKYLLFDVESHHQGGWLILHLGMSGSLRLVSPGTAAQKHDHVDLLFAHTVLRLRDPRRFGFLLWHAGTAILQHPLLAVLGVEPLSPEFTGDSLYTLTRQRRTPIKPLLMNSHLIVGIGNIYAAESLFLAGISPLRAAGSLNRPQCHRLAEAIRETLQKSIAAGGSSLRDYVHSDGGAGSFQLDCAVYGREGKPCLRCQHPVSCLRQAGRSSFYCAGCQE